MRGSHFTFSLRALSVAVALALTACANPATRTMEAQADAASDAEQRVASQQASIGDHSRPVARVHDSQWVDISPAEHPAELDRRAKACSVNFHPGHTISLTELQKMMAAGECKVTLKFTPDALARLHGGAKAGASDTLLPADPAGGTPQPYTGGVGADPMVDVNFNGDVDAFLDRIASQIGLFARREGDTGEFFYTETKLYRINLKKNSTTQTSTVQSGISSGGSGSGGAQGAQQSGQGSAGTQQMTTQTSTTDPTKDFGPLIGAVVPKDAYSYNEGTGQLVVTATPDKQAQVQRIVDQFNDIVTKQVKLKLVVGIFTRTNNDNLGVNGTVNYTSPAGLGLNLSNSFPITSGGSTADVNVLNTATGKLSKFAGTSLVIAALRKMGTVDVVQEQVIYTLNLHPAPYQDGQQTTYLAQTSNTLTSGGQATGFSQSALIPGVVNTGFNVVTSPFVYADGKTMSLEFKMNLSALDQLTPLTDGKGNTIQGPQLSDNVVDQTVRIRSGNTLLITGIRNHNNKAGKSGTVSAGFWGLGGGINNDESRKVGFVLVTPEVE